MVVRAAAVAIAAGVCLIGCTQAAPSIECGEGTVLESGVCVRAGLMCGTGTHEDAGMCVADGGIRFELRTEPSLRADGHSSTEVRVFGIAPDGSPSHDRVVLGTDRTGSGVFISPIVVLDELGASSQFLPCNSVTAGCVGPVRLTVALASAPTATLAGLDVTLEAPTPIGDPAPCLTGGDVLHLEGHDFMFDGARTLVAPDATFHGMGGAIAASLGAGTTSEAWQVAFSTDKLDVNLVPSVYLDGFVAGTPGGAGHPTFQLDGPFSSPCTMRVDNFQIHELAFDPTNLHGYNLEKLTATFTQQCVFEPARTLSGCVHFGP